MAKSKYADYLGDGVYVDWDGYHIILKANDFDNPTDTIYLDNYVLSAFSKYQERLNKIIQNEINQQEKL